MLTTAIETMPAIVSDRYGEAGTVLRLEPTAVPVPGPDEVLVRVRAAGVDRGTWHMVAGRPKLIRFMGFGLRGPKTRVAGRALAGTVEAIGRDVAGFEIGDEVFGSADGSFAELASAPAKQLALKPTNLSFEQAAAVPISADTALQALRDKAAVEAGERALIIGASGGVGTYAVQIAKALGAVVTGVCSTAKVDMVRALGADHVVDYQRENFADGAQYDVIIDIGGNSRLSRLRRALTPRGRLVIVGGETDGAWLGGFDRSLRAPLLSLFVGQQLTMLAAKERGADLDVLRGLIESAQVTPAIDRTYPLAEAAAAIEYLHQGHARGKVVITVD